MRDEMTLSTMQNEQQQGQQQCVLPASLVPPSVPSFRQPQSYFQHEQQQQQHVKKLFSDPIVQLEFISDEDVILTCTSEPRVPSIVKALQSAKPFLPFQFVPKTSTNNDRNCAFWMFPREVAGKVQSVLYARLARALALNLFPNLGSVTANTLPHCPGTQHK